MPARLGDEDGGTYAPGAGQQFPQAQIDRMNRFDAARAEIQKAMAADAQRRAAYPNARQQSISDMINQARRRADEQLRLARQRQAEEMARARAREAQRRVEWNRLNPKAQQQNPWGPLLGPPQGDTTDPFDRYMNAQREASQEAEAAKAKGASRGGARFGAEDGGGYAPLADPANDPKPLSAEGKAYNQTIKVAEEARQKGMAEFRKRKAVEAVQKAKDNDPAIKKYRELLEQWQSQTRSALDGPGQDGGLFGDIIGENDTRIAMAFPNVSGQGFPYFLTKDDKGNWVVEDATSIYQSYMEQTMNPDTAGELAYSLNAAGYYGTTAGKALMNRFQEYTKPDGTKSLRILWNKDDADALEMALKDSTNRQAALARKGEYVDFKEIIEQKALAGLGMAKEGVGVETGDGGGGRRGGWGYGGGGGYAPPPAQVSSFDNVMLASKTLAKERLGRELTGEEAKSLTARINELEMKDHANMLAGATRTDYNPEAIINTWITEMLGKEETKQQQGELMMAFMQLVGAGGFGGIGGDL